MRRIPGERAPNAKNRSSKHLNLLTGYTPFARTLSNEALARYSGPEFAKERRRRDAKAAKKAGKAKA